MEGNRVEEEERVDEEDEKEEEERAGTSGRTADVKISCRVASVAIKRNEKREGNKDKVLLVQTEGCYFLPVVLFCVGVMVNFTADDLLMWYSKICPHQKYASMHRVQASRQLPYNMPVGHTRPRLGNNLTHRPVPGL